MRWWFRSVSVTANSMEQSPSWAADSSPASQEIPRSLWNPKVHCRVHKRPPPIPNFDPQHYIPCSPSHFLKTHFNITIPSTPRSSKWYIFYRVFPPKPSMHLFCPCHMALLSHSSCSSHVNNTGSCKKIWTSSTLATEVTGPDTLWFFPMGIR